jgi:hypothetical protein
MSEETGGLDQPDGCQEGPFINRPPGWVNSFFGISEDLSLRERCMREICTCSVSGGRRPARKRASSDPTVHGELHDARHLLGWATDTIELSCPVKPQSGVDSHRVSVRSDDNAIFDEAAGRIPRLPHRASVLLRKPSAPWGHAVLQLGVCRRNQSCEGRNAQRGSGCDQTSNRDRTGTKCARCLALRGQHIFEHRIHRLRATQLCNRATFHAASFLIRRPVERLERWRKLLRH